MDYKVPYTETPTLLEIAQNNNIEILGNFEFSESDSLHHVAKKVNEILFNTLFSTRTRFVDDTRYLTHWLSVMCKMMDDQDVLFKDCFQSSVFEKVYFGHNLFTGTQSDMEIVRNREEFIREFGIDSFIKVKRPAWGRVHLDHFESYKNRKGKIIIVTSPYGDEVAPKPLEKYKMMYHPNATTFVAVFENKVQYNDWVKGLER